LYLITHKTRKQNTHSSQLQPAGLQTKMRQYRAESSRWVEPETCQTCFKLQFSTSKKAHDTI